MCGICGYVGERNAVDVLQEGLARLEYRGYDSAGIAVIEDAAIRCEKAPGQLVNLRAACDESGIAGVTGIGHTRWATHGPANAVNAHPHLSYDGSCAVVHNGIIENFSDIKKALVKDGITFVSDTDTEIIAHLFAKHYRGSLKEAMLATLDYLEGTYGLVVLHKNHPHTLIGARHGSPMVIAKAEGEMFFASDPAAIRRYSDNVIYMEEGEIAEISRDSFVIFNRKSEPVTRAIHKLTWDLADIEKGEFSTFMEKEIHEHPASVRAALAGRVKFDEASALLTGMNVSLEQLHGFEAVKILSIGTSFYAAEVGAMLIESVARVRASAEVSAEFVCRNPVIDDKTMYIILSQSGETYDSMLALREIKRHGVQVRGVCNVVGSSISRETDGGSYTHSGTEISVASTKAFSGQLAVLYLLALKMARARSMSFSEGAKFIEHLQSIPEKMEQILLQKEAVRKLAKKYAASESLMYLGRGLGLPVAKEAALKLKEISYINANAYSASEMKHGPIALIDETVPSIFLFGDDVFNVKMKNNIREIKARGGPVAVVAPQGLEACAEFADDAIFIPKTHELFYPLLLTVPAHLFALYVAEERQLNVDKPRNLAKSVTVE